MLKWSQAAVVLLFTIALLSPGAFAQASSENDRRFTYGAEADPHSAYVWRGIAFDNRPVLQPSAWISRSGFTFAAWANRPLTNTPEGTHLRTTNVSLTYGRDWRKLRIEPAIEAYVNQPPPGVDDPNTVEGSLKLSYPVGPLRVFTKNTFDVRAYRRAYFGEAGLGYERQVSHKASFAVSVHSGWASSKFNEVYIGLDKPAFNVIGVDGSLLYHLKPYLYFQPHFAFSNIVDPQLREYLPWPTIIHFGLAMGFEF